MSIVSRLLRRAWKSLATKNTFRRSTRFCCPCLELLEDRTLLNWTPIGPAPQTDPGLLIPASQPREGLDQNYSGRVSALAVSAGYAPDYDALFAGSASGGIWRTLLSPSSNGWQQLTPTLMPLPAG